MIFHLREKLHVGRDYRPPICALENERKREREKREAHPRALGGKRVAGPLEGIVGN